jgi:hypothetical protein
MYEDSIMKFTKYCLKKEAEEGEELSEYNRGDDLVQSTLYAFMKYSRCNHPFTLNKF